MKYILSLILAISSLFSIGQVGKKYDNIRLDRSLLPAYILANENDTIGIAFSIYDVQKIDKSLQVLEYLETRSTKIDTTLFYYISLVGDLDIKIGLLNTKVSDLQSDGIIKDSMIKDLQERLSILIETNMKNEKISKNKDIIIENQKKDIKKQKFLKTLYLGIGTTIVIILTVLSVSGS